MKFIKSKPIGVFLHKKLVLDSRLSLNAKALYAQLSLLRPDYNISYTELSKWNKNGTQSIKNAIDELLQANYLRQDGQNYVFEQIEDVKIQAPVKKQSTETKIPNHWLKLRKEQARKFADEMVAANDSNSKKLNRTELKEFLKYWTEIDTMNPKKKMPFQAKKTFDIKRRLNTWRINQDKFNKAQTTKGRL